MLVVPDRVSLRNVLQTLSLRGRRSRNKVSVGEPAEGSFAHFHIYHSLCMNERLLDTCFHPPRTTQCFLFYHHEIYFRLVDVAISLQCMRCYLSLATTNALARGSLKDAANCAKHLELQISEKEKDSERILRVDFVSAHVIGGDRNMQSLELRSLSGLHMLSQFLAPTCSCDSARLSFSSSIMISCHDVRID